MNIHPRRWIYPAVTLLLVMALSACASASPTAVPLSEATQPASETIAVPTVSTVVITTTTPTPTEGPPLLSGSDVEFQDMQFTLPGDLVSDVQARVVPGTDRLGELYPAYTEFT